MYNISIEGIVEGDTATPRSNEILAHTDVDKPGPPIITNLTCIDTGSLYVEWIRPKRYGLYVNTYKIYYGPLNQLPKELNVQAIPGVVKSQVRSQKKA